MSAEASTLSPLLRWPASSALTMMGGRSSLCVLMYHRVHEHMDLLQPQSIDVAGFTRHMRIVRELMNPLPLPEALERLQRGALPRRAVCVTFDDGYADNLHVALPILSSLKVPATVFVTTGFLHGRLMWNDMIIETVRRLPVGEYRFEELSPCVRRIDQSGDRTLLVRDLIRACKYLEPQARAVRVQEILERSGIALPTDLMLTPDGVRALHGAGVTIGGHTVSHPILARVSDDEAVREIEQGRAELRDILDAPVDLFAYPNGRPGRDYLARHVQLVKQAGFKFAVSTAWGIARSGMDSLQIPRIGLWASTARLTIARLLTTYAQRRVEAV